MRVTLLGTAGWMPTERRETTCFALRSGDALFILDAGTGLRRLAEERHRDLVDGVREVHLFLTHYHLDHVCGLAYLPGVLPRHRVTVHAASAELTGVDPEAALSGLLRRPYNPHDWSDLQHIAVETVADGAIIAGRRIGVRAQHHSDVSVAYRVDDALVLATDTIPDPGTSEFAAGASVLLHEAWYSRADFAASDLPKGYQSHSDVESVAEVAAGAGVGRLVLIHLNPLQNETYYRRLQTAARATFVKAALHDDDDVIDCRR